MAEIDKLRRQESLQNDEDAEDRQKIEEAMATYGDYKLKVNDNYSVPENLRVNYQRKKQQMVLLQASIHRLKLDFDQKIDDLKLRKKQIVEHVTVVNKRLKEINEELGVSDALTVPVIDHEVEYPENFFNTNDEEVEQYMK